MEIAPFDRFLDRSPMAEQLAVRIGHASESGHWYDRQGNLIEQIQYRDWKKRKADGRPEYRDVTLADAKKLILAPGITSVLFECHKPQLERWKIEQAVMAALTFPRPPGMSEPDYLSALNEDMNAQSKAAREAGTAIHGAVERNYLGKPYDEQYRPQVEATVAAVDDCCGLQAWQAEESFAADEGYGTKIDLCCPPWGASADDKYKGWVLNFKTKDGTQEKLDAMARGKPYDEYCMQQAAERRAFGWWHARCALVLISRTHPGAVAVQEIPEPELQRGWEMFLDLLSFWQHKRGYRAWRKEV